MEMEIQIGMRLDSISQISRALKAGFAVMAELYEIDNDWGGPYDLLLEDFTVIVYSLNDLRKMHVSGYNQLRGIVDHDCVPFWDGMHYKYWTFTVVAK